MSYMRPIKVSNQTAPEVVEVAKRAFPEYHGRRFRVGVFSGPRRLTSGWDGGSKSWYSVVPLVPGKVREVIYTVPENGTFPTQNGGSQCVLSDLPEGMALVERSVFCGKEAGITVYVHANNFNNRLIAEGVNE